MYRGYDSQTMKIYKSVDEDGVAERLVDGQIGVVPTDTIYGIVCQASDETAVKRLYGMKSRIKKPGTIIAANIDQLVNLGIKRRYLKAVEQYWPGPTSVEIPHSIEYLNQGTGRQAIRIPDNEKLLNLLAKTGPLQTTSANLPDKPPAVRSVKQ